ncbi:MAG: nucleotidyltransferase domain-containing protein [Spirochaetaceae bacterium]|jgi:predicted nucleotidyltransferase|nr:nucleotidyltransferase domain-containing protein [Spirochaetaceae bacterium]
MAWNNMEYGLPDNTLNTLDSIFRKYPGIREVVLYGSRAKGKYRRGSDIDMSLKTDETFTHTDLLRVVGDFDDSDIPYFVDVSIYDRLSNHELKAHIDRVGKVLYSVYSN